MRLENHSCPRNPGRVSADLPVGRSRRRHTAQHEALHEPPARSGNLPAHHGSESNWQKNATLCITDSLFGNFCGLEALCNLFTFLSVLWKNAACRSWEAAFLLQCTCPNGSNSSARRVTLKSTSKPSGSAARRPCVTKPGADIGEPSSTAAALSAIGVQGLY